MGSSPVTATISSSISPRSLAHRLAHELEAFLRGPAGLAPRESVLVAFSGGPDSTALLIGLTAAARRMPFRIVAAHVDHGLDAGSAERGERSRALATSLDVPFRLRRGPVDDAVRSRDGIEAAARELRYRALEATRREEGARWVLTGHHRDDQAETVLLRLAHGTGLRGLSGMEPIRGHVARPLLGWSRLELERIVRDAGLDPLRDPTNRDLDRPRNRLRHAVLPARPRWTASAIAAAGAASRLRERLDRRFRGWIEAGPSPSVSLSQVAGVHSVVRAWVLSLLHETAGRPHPPPASAMAELERQLGLGGRIGVDCGGGWRWVGARDRLHLRAPRAETPAFAYTFEVPGAVELREIGCRLRVERQPVAPWMRRGRPDRAALRLPFDGGGALEVRNRRPGDRLRPLGAPYERSLKEMLIDHKIPRHERNRLPLLCVEGTIAWIPGVAIHEAYRLEAGDTIAWVAILEPSP